MIVCLIYKSVGYLNFIYEQIKDYSYMFVANDATPEVLEALKGKNHIIYNDPKPEAYYLERVYRAWNFGGFNVDSDIIIFVNSDMWFGPNWIDNLLKHFDRNTIPVSRCIEAGKYKAINHAITKYFGNSWTNLNTNGILNYMNKISEDKILPNGYFMPCVFYKDDFIKSGGYPEGNVGKISGDKYFFYNNLIMKEKKHITVCNSLVYHIWEGEMDG